MFPSLETLHSFPHISMSLQSIPSVFNLTVAYLQSLMFIVAVLLAIGFFTLVLLALFLCMVISFVPPVIQPRTSFRLVVTVLSCLVFALSSPVVAASEQCSRGVHALVVGIQHLSLLIQTVLAQEPQLLDAATQLNETASAAAACMQCHHMPNSTACRALEMAHGTPLAVFAFTSTLESGRQEADHMSELVHLTTRWHSWAASVPLFALGCISMAVVCGAIYGKRNLLVLAQFAAVVIWWMMCAVISVEVAMSVGLADFCLTPRETVLHVLLTVAGVDAPPSAFWSYNLTAHYLTNCSVPNPLAAPLQQIEHTCAGLPAASVAPACADRLDAVADVARSLRSLVAVQLDPLGRAAECGGNGTVASLFEQGIEVGVCEDVVAGFVGTFLHQLIGGLLLLLLSLLLPGLWHSHQLLPLTCRLASWPRWSYVSRPIRQLHEWQRLTPLSAPLEPSYDADQGPDERQRAESERPLQAQLEHASPSRFSEELATHSAVHGESVHESASSDGL